MPCTGRGSPGGVAGAALCVLVACGGTGGERAPVPPSYDVSGRVLGSTAAQVAISLEGAGGTSVGALTDADGRYVLVGVPDGEYTVGARKDGFTFSPVSTDVAVSGADVEGPSFIATAVGETHRVDGVVGSANAADVAGIAVTLTGDATGTTTTDSSGHYAFTGLPNGVFTVTPGKARFDFSPASRSVTVIGADVTLGAFWSWFAPSATSVQSGTNEWLLGVWGSGRDDVWAVGGWGALLHWDGTAWSPAGAFSTASGPWLAGVWGTGADDTWVVGDAGTIVRWDGSAWAATPSGTSESLAGIWGSGRDDVWAVGGSGTILHWDGHAWTSVAGASDDDVYAVWGSGSRDVWAVGNFGTIQHWDGTAWSVVPSPMAMALNGVWGSGPNDVWAVGSAWSWDTAVPIVLHWGGSAWTSVATGAPSDLWAVWGSGSDDVWTVGIDGVIVRLR